MFFSSSPARCLIAFSPAPSPTWSPVCSIYSRPPAPLLQIADKKLRDEEAAAEEARKAHGNQTAGVLVSSDGKKPDQKFRALIMDAWSYSGKNVAGSKGAFVDDNKYLVYGYSRAAVMFRDTAMSPLFSNFVTFCIIMAGICVGISAEFQRVDTDPHPQDKEGGKNLGLFLWYSNIIINWVFTVEVALKLLGEDYHPWTFFYRFVHPMMFPHPSWTRCA